MKLVLQFKIYLLVFHLCPEAKGKHLMMKLKGFTHMIVDLFIFNKIHNSILLVIKIKIFYLYHLIHAIKSLVYYLFKFVWHCHIYK
jgi:hypothetical protein